MLKFTQKIVVFVILAAFIDTSLNLPVYASLLPAAKTPAVFNPASRLPRPGVRVHLSPPFELAVLQGLCVHPNNPFRFDFLINRGDEILSGAQKKQEYKKLVKYFLASLTIPDKDQWVNLSPYEKNRIIEDDFGKTEMGRDLLAQDYILKQITASLIYPEGHLGKEFWDRVYQLAWKEYHTTDIPVHCCLN